MLRALEALVEPSAVTVWSDSRRLVDEMTEGWIRRWTVEMWGILGPIDTANQDLWERLLKMYQTHAVMFNCMETHPLKKDNYIHEEPADETVMQEDLPADLGYEQSQRDVPKINICPGS